MRWPYAGNDKVRFYKLGGAGGAVRTLPPSRRVNPGSAEAATFCAYGALMRALHEQGLHDRWLAEMFNTGALRQLIRSNDSGTHADALASLHVLGSDV